MTITSITCSIDSIGRHGDASLCAKLLTGSVGAGAGEVCPQLHILVCACFLSTRPFKGRRPSRATSRASCSRRGYAPPIVDGDVALEHRPAQHLRNKSHPRLLAATTVTLCFLRVLASYRTSSACEDVVEGWGKARCL